MKINNLLVVSPMYEELKAIIEKEDLQKNIRFLPEEKMTQEPVRSAKRLQRFSQDLGWKSMGSL
ncbi:hypothetical protein SAMN05428981_11074 [Bacillus sp. OV194]|nr:hypothetical protein SAMN05428981_11074 [Bacillus sp. OV194]